MNKEKLKVIKNNLLLVHREKYVDTFELARVIEAILEEEKVEVNKEKGWE
jgi:hypothetical protein